MGNESNIPTAEEFIKEYLGVDDEFIESMREQMANLSGFDFDNLTDLMVEFTKFHRIKILEAAAKNASHNHKVYDSTFIINKNSILESYPIENIKL